MCVLVQPRCVLAGGSELQPRPGRPAGSPPPLQATMDVLLQAAAAEEAAALAWERRATLLCRAADLQERELTQRSLRFPTCISEDELEPAMAKEEEEDEPAAGEDPYARVPAEDEDAEPQQEPPSEMMRLEEWAEADLADGASDSVEVTAPATPHGIRTPRRRPTPPVGAPPPAVLLARGAAAMFAPTMPPQATAAASGGVGAPRRRSCHRGRGGKGKLCREPYSHREGRGVGCGAGGPGAPVIGARLTGSQR